ncbi:nickel pincer cofactor biosynthesis protein LarB [Desulfovibrio desulfuricans]|uniref:Nickel pincer cofactor biosynthesis protein LarB n=1 Tax=Desulfovibrio desulfuricans TaxID=876 RepID=A0A4P7ULD0_DESDE|nr:nickel pincer cofactor biosynthesis protein LarB [Desulfovibrio desulfuricans]QCC85688.1 nickel pincer cofactor biosynthesis protein LarB [Desulfovibrio desulfuricans]
MSCGSLEKLLTDIKSGSVSVADGMNMLRDSAVLDLGHTKFDLQRPARNGFPEVVYGEGKTPEQVGEIFVRVGERGNVLATRVSAQMAAHVQSVCPHAEYNALGRAMTLVTRPIVWKQGEVAIVTAGTSDLPVAEEALVTCRMMGVRAKIIADVGVAGIHRLMCNLPEVRAARAIIVVAGMEGALASVVGGLVAQPVVAVPTSVGYGASFAGLSALLGMLTSCASGVTVTNIDNGFGAACAACRIINACESSANA